MKKKVFAGLLVIVLLTLAVGVVPAYARDKTPPSEYRTVPLCRGTTLDLEYEARYYNYLTKTWSAWKLLRTKHIGSGCAEKLMAPVPDSYGARLNFVWAKGSQGINLSGRFEGIALGGGGYSTCLVQEGDTGCRAFAATQVFQPNGSWFQIFFLSTGAYEPIPLLVVYDTKCTRYPAHSCFALGPNQELTAVVALPDELALVEALRNNP